MTIKYAELKRRYELDGPRQTCQHLREALAEGDLSPADFSVRDLAEALVPDGREWVRTLDPRDGGLSVVEAEAVDTTAFLNTMGQIVYSRILQGAMNESFVLSRLVDTIPTRLNGEIIPGVGSVPASGINAVNEGMPFENLGFGEDYITTPATTKRGFIVPVTKEAIFFDRTALILRRASEVGEILGIDKEKRLADLVSGVTNNFSWQGTSYNTYQTATPWINSSTQKLNDWTDLDEQEQLFANMLDPNTSEPIVMNTANLTLLVTPANANTGIVILGATSVRKGDGASLTPVTLADNPMAGKGYNLAVSRQLYRRLIASGVAAATAAPYWYFGDFRRAFAYMENWPITVAQAPNNSEAEFTSDIVARFKASERGAAAVLNPRHVAKSTGAV